MKKVIGIVLVITMLMSAAFLSACSNENASSTTSSNNTAQSDKTTASTGNSSSNTSSSAPVEIRVAWWGDTTRNKLYEQILDAFETEYPNIKTVREPLSWTDYWDKLTVQSASGGAPDFLGMHPQFASDYVHRGVLEPLDNFVKDGTIDLSNFTQAAIDSGKVDNTIYMVSMGLTAASMFVNTTMLQELNVAVPNFDWTWDDLKAIGLATRKALDAKGEENAWLIDDGSGAYQLFRYWVRQNGKIDLYTADGKIAYTAEDAASWFTMWEDLRDNKIVPDAATTTEYAKATLEDSLFARKKTAIRGVPANQYKLYCEALPNDKIIMVRNPAMVNGKVAEYVEGAHFAISAKTTPEKKLAAAKLLNFWVNDEDSIKLFKLDQGVPANTKMVEYLNSLLDDQDKAVVDYVNKIASISTEPTTFPPSGASTVDSLFQQIAEKVRFGQLTPKDAGEQLVSQAQATLDSNKK